MTTIVEAMTDATLELHNAALELRTARDTFVSTSQSNIAATTALVATVTPISRLWWVDPNNGNDANDGSTAALAKKTLDSVCFNAPPNTRHVVLLLGDTTVLNATIVNATISISGAQAANNANGWIPARRRIDFKPEAINSPTSDGARRSGGFLMSAQMSFRTCDLVIPDVSAGVNGYCFLGSNLSTVTLTDCTVNGTTPTNNARLLVTSDASPMGFWFSGTIGSGAQGRIFDGIAVGADPNTGKRYMSNLSTN